MQRKQFDGGSDRPDGAIDGGPIDMVETDPIESVVLINPPDSTEVPYVNLVHPMTGEILPTVKWVADSLLATGWRRQE